MSEVVYNGESNASRVVKTLLENEAIPAPSPYGKRVRVRTPKGEVHGDWNGYYDMREIGGGLHHSIGYPDTQGGFSHGMLHPGDEILDPVPSHEEWWEKKRRDAEHAAKLAQMRQEI